MQQRESIRFKPGDRVRIKGGYSRAIAAGFTPASTVWRQISNVRGVMCE